MQRKPARIIISMIFIIAFCAGYWILYTGCEPCCNPKLYNTGNPVPEIEIQKPGEAPGTPGQQTNPGTIIDPSKIQGDESQQGNPGGGGGGGGGGGSGGGGC